MWLSRPRLIRVLLSGAALIACTGTPDPLGAPQPEGRQERLMQLKSWTIAQPGLDTSGYIESVNDAAALSTVLLWNGPANGTQRAIITEASRRGITVTIQQRKYSRAELVQAATNVIIPGFQVRSATGITADFDGIDVQGVPTSAAVTAESAAAAAEKQLGVAVTVDIGGGDTPFTASF